MIEQIQTNQLTSASFDLYTKINGKLNDQFQRYLLEKYGVELWSRLLQNEKFNKLITVHANKFGDLIFQELVNHASDIIRIDVSYILSDLFNKKRYAGFSIRL